MVCQRTLDQRPDTRRQFQKQNHLVSLSSFLGPPNLFRVGAMNEDLNFLDLGAGYLADVLVYCPFYAGILSLASANGPSNKMQGWT